RVPDAPEPQSPSVRDVLLNGPETGVDWGGSCPGCPVGTNCGINADCQSGVGVGGKCTGLSCTDGIKNAHETDIDCGGGCPPCYQGKSGLSYTDCVSYVCSAGTCST